MSRNLFDKLPREIHGEIAGYIRKAIDLRNARGGGLIVDEHRLAGLDLAEHRLKYRLCMDVIKTLVWRSYGTDARILFILFEYNISRYRLITYKYGKDDLAVNHVKNYHKSNRKDLEHYIRWDITPSQIKIRYLNSIDVW